MFKLDEMDKLVSLGNSLKEGSAQKKVQLLHKNGIAPKERRCDRNMVKSLKCRFCTVMA